MTFTFVFEITISVLAKTKKGSFFSCCCIPHHGRHKGSLSVLKTCGSGTWIPRKAWKSLTDLLNTGINCGLETIAKGAFWLGTSTAAIFPFANCPGTIWNWVVFNKLGAASKLFMWLGVERAKLVDPRGEAIGKLMAWDCGNGSFSNVGGAGFITDEHGVQYEARCERSRARTSTSTASNDIR